MSFCSKIRISTVEKKWRRNSESDAGLRSASVWWGLTPASPLGIALNRRRRRLQKGIEALPDDCVTLARCLFEPSTIENLNRSPAVTDKPGDLHGLCGKRHRLAIGTQDMGEKLMGVRQGFAFGPIMHH